MKIPFSSIFLNYSTWFITYTSDCQLLLIICCHRYFGNTQFVAFIVNLQPNQGTEEYWASLELITEDETLLQRFTLYRFFQY